MSLSNVLSTWNGDPSCVRSRRTVNWTKKGIDTWLDFWDRVQSKLETQSRRKLLEKRVWIRIANTRLQPSTGLYQHVRLRSLCSVPGRVFRPCFVSCFLSSRGVSWVRLISLRVFHYTSSPWEVQGNLLESVYDDKGYLDVFSVNGYK